MTSPATLQHLSELALVLVRLIQHTPKSGKITISRSSGHDDKAWCAIGIDSPIHLDRAHLSQGLDLQVACRIDNPGSRLEVHLPE